jgi:hypothetical protein
MSNVLDTVIGGALVLKGGLSLTKPAKRKKSHKKKKEKKAKKDDKKSKHKEKGNGEDKRVRFETGDLDAGSAGAAAAAADSSLHTDLALVEGDEDGGSGGGGKEDEGGYDPLSDPTLTATQRRHLEAQRKRYVVCFGGLARSLATPRCLNCDRWLWSWGSALVVDARTA